MLLIIIGLLLLAVFQRIQLRRERRAHSDTQRALTWWRDERCGRHGHRPSQRCDGDHALPICGDRECWQREDM